MNGENRIVDLLKDDWLFHLGDVEDGHLADFEDERWEEVDIPHDWSIRGQFKRYRAENWFMFQNLDYRIGYLPQGIGWYRKHLKVPKDWKSRRVFLMFDGIYRDSDVWINGKHVGRRPYGYISFYYDITRHLLHGKDNVIAVRVDNEGVSSRWYAGSGIYRKVRLLVLSPIHFKIWDSYWQTRNVNSERAEVDIISEIAVPERFIPSNGEKEHEIILKTNIIYQNQVISEKETPIIHLHRNTAVTQTHVIKNPKLWDPDNPELYDVKMLLSRNEKSLDEICLPLGIRSFRFDPTDGFFLNGKSMKFKGVCLHHDNGCLGSAVYKHAIERKIKILKEMGCNAIRTSHNPPSQELLDVCDSLGILVMDEAFDEWTLRKTPKGYWNHFNEWYERDVKDFIKRDRNHPSVIVWSCGNEVSEQKQKSGVAVLKKLLDVFHEVDPTRPVTQGCNNMKEANESGFAQLLDIAGYNYYGDRVIASSPDGFKCMYDKEHEEYPERILIGTENCSAFNTRGVYHFPPVFGRWDKKNEDFHCSSYDVTTEIPLIILKTRPYVCGMFTWEGIDYLGEPTPYQWPARSSQFGILDLCGFPKDIYWLYQSQWTDKDVLHILPHWNWHRGMTIPVWVYTNCDTVEIFLNDKSLGKKSFLSDEYDDILHLMWDVDWEPGTIKAVGYRNDKEILTETVVTTKPPYQIRMNIHNESIKTSGDIAFLEISVCDIDGRVVPTAHNLIRFTAEGEGEIIGVGNGNPISHEPFYDEQRHAFNGLCLAVVKSTDDTGSIKITATSASLKSAEVVLNY